MRIVCHPASRGTQEESDAAGKMSLVSDKLRGLRTSQEQMSRRQVSIPEGKVGTKEIDILEFPICRR